MLVSWVIFILCFLCAVACVSAIIPNSTSYHEDLWEKDYGRIIHASVLFRHGDRSIIEPYPTDPYPASIWEDGLGQLSKIGKEREYELGLWLRERYKTIFKDRYKHDVILVNSSNVDRTLMSAELVLAAMFPPGELDMWNKFNFTWQPIPVHTVPTDEDYFISQEVPCDRYDVEVGLANGSPDLLAYYAAHANVFKYAGEYAGYTMSSDDVMESLRNIDKLNDVLFIESSNNLKLPRWTDKVYPYPLSEIAGFTFAVPGYTHEMRRLKAGPILGSLINDARSKIRGHFNQTLHLYSGHDSTLANVMTALGVFNYLIPPYSSSLLFELRKKEDDYFITISYRNSSTEPPHLLNFTDCHGVCTLNQFIDLTADLIFSDYYAECDIGLVEKFASFNFIRILIASSVLLSVAVIFFLQNLRKNRKQRYVHYRCVANEVLTTPA